MLENVGDLAEAFYVDQQRWRSTDTFDELAKRNAGWVFEEMECLVTFCEIIQSLKTFFIRLKI